MSQKYRVTFGYQIFKCGSPQPDHRNDTLMHEASGSYENMDYANLVQLEGALLGSLMKLGAEELERKK